MAAVRGWLGWRLTYLEGDTSCWLGPQLWLLPRAPPCGLSLLPGLSHSMAPVFYHKLSLSLLSIGPGSHKTFPAWRGGDIGSPLNINRRMVRFWKSLWTKKYSWVTWKMQPALSHLGDPLTAGPLVFGRPHSSPRSRLHPEAASHWVTPHPRPRLHYLSPSKNSGTSQTACTFPTYPLPQTCGG